MGILRVALFGRARVTHGSWEDEVKLTRILRLLLAYLLLQPRGTSQRDVIAGCLWGDHDQEKARACLNTALWRLRRSLEPEGVPPGTYLLAPATGEVGFNFASDHWLDLSIFQEQANRVVTQPVAKIRPSEALELENALHLYTAELLEGIYEDWALRERERVRLLYLKSLATLMDWHQSQGDLEESLVFGRRILEIEPLREEVHRGMMRLYLASGQRALAVRQYYACRKILADELGILPMEETQALFKQIVAGQAGFAGETASLHPALGQLHQASQALNEAQEELRQAIRLVHGMDETGD